MTIATVKNKLIAAQHCHPNATQTLIAEALEVIDEMAQAAQPAPTVPDQMQDWKGMDGTTAWHLIERHADNWADVGKMMGEWLAANQVTQPAHAHAIDTSPERVEKQAGDVQVPEGWQLVARVYSKHGDPEAFGEREIETLIDLKTIPYKTNLYAAPSTKEDV